MAKKDNLSAALKEAENPKYRYEYSRRGAELIITMHEIDE